MSSFLGAYATSPCVSGWDEAAETAYYAALKSLPGLRGLEYPFTGRLHPHDDDWLLHNLDPAWDIVLTLLPGSMDRLAADPQFGLASDNAQGRTAAVAFTAEARAVVARLNAAAGRRRVVAVELNSGPRRGVAGVSSSVAALTASLVEIAAWDWEDAHLVVEHCDAWRADLQPTKGFLDAGDEIAAVCAANAASGAMIGIAVNWGRSVLEARDPARALHHVAAAKQAGVLAGLMFSGCSAADTPWGVWQDSHMPHADAAAGSLMTEDAIAACLRAAGDGLVYVGGKLTARPNDAGLERRVGLNRDLLAVLNRLTAATAEESTG
ncbi:MAG TPA: DUF4862 family protein [Patescibacteria group bacterium]|nr:DUF4862 family protein [Patescibacteria group bacterium]